MINRRQLLGYAGAAGAAMTVGMLPGLRNVRGGTGPSAATLAFMRRARFETPRQAIYGMKDPNIPFLIEHVAS